MKKSLLGASIALAVLLAPAVGLADPNCTNTCTRYCSQNYDPDSTNYGICFEGCIHGCVYGPEVSIVFRG